MKPPAHFARMTRTLRRAVTLACLAPPLFAAALPAQPVAGVGPGRNSETPPVTSGRCGVCHPSERVLFEKSRHAGEDVHCTACHGGNDQSLDPAQAHQGNGFRGKLTRQEIPGMCASCHSDEKRMRPHDLPVDQYALYQISAHGIKLRAGDPRVAVCSDCHGAHDILSPRDPESRVYVTNIPRTCGRCHGDSALVRERGIKDAYHDYLNSVHATELLDKGNLRAPTCVSCHGVHGAAPAEVGNVNKICGRCHTAERRYFLTGPHAKGMASNDLPECSSCHGDHSIKTTQTAQLASRCLDCHAAGSPEAQAGAHLLADYRSASAEIAKADALIAKADDIPIQTDDYRARVEEARTYLREALTAAHAVQPEVMANFAVRARSVGSEVQTDLRKKMGDLFTNRLLLIVFWFYVFVTIGILLRYRNRHSQAK